MERRSAYRFIAGAMGAMTLGAIPANAHAPQVAVLSTIEPGAWQLKEVDGHASRTLCIAHGRQLIQIRHRDLSECSRFVVANEPREATVHYTCPGAGHGRTTIGLVTPRSISLDTQGIAGGLPFKERYTGRRIGECSRPARD